MANAVVKKDIRYLGRDFNQFRANLMTFAKTYFQDTFNDNSESSVFSMLTEVSCYVGDVLSYYLDTSIKELMLLHAEERKNVLSLAQSLGYRPRVTSPSITEVEVFQLLPSIGTGVTNVPDYRYCLKLNPGMIVSSIENSNVNFRTKTELDFSFSSSFNPTDVSVYQTANGEPSYY